MDPATRALHELVRSAERLTRARRRRMEALHADLGLTGRGFMVMDRLARAPATAPDVAREAGVTRQHVQAALDALQTDGFAERRPNPASRKSPLWALTRRGQALHHTAATREALALREASDRMDAAALAEADAVLRAALKRLEGGQKS